MTDLRQDSMTGEQWVFEERTADPPTTEEGERWLRTDLNSGDKIATLRVDVGSSIRDVPIFSTGTAVDTVSEAMRIQVNGVTGYVPIVPVSDAAYPELRMQHNSQVHGFHDRVEPGTAILDSGDHQWKMAEGSGTALADSIGSLSATINGATWQSEAGAVGGEYLSLDGSNDYWETDATATLTNCTICGWVRPDEYTGFSNQLVSWGDNINGSSNRDGFYIDTADTNGELLTVSGSGGSASSVLTNVPFVPIGDWGFFALNYDGSNHRMITFDTSQELADTSASVTHIASGDHAIYGGGNPSDADHFAGDQDFYVAAAGRTLSKSEITELWQATNDR